MNNANPLTPPTSPVLSHNQKYGWVLGQPLIVLPKRKWTQRDVLRHWIHMSDTKTGSNSSDILKLVAKYVLMFSRILNCFYEKTQNFRSFSL